MGGYGSGRPRSQSRRLLVEDSVTLDATQLTRTALKQGGSGAGWLEWTTPTGASRVPFNINIERRRAELAVGFPCSPGGKNRSLFVDMCRHGKGTAARWYFLCPGLGQPFGCRRRTKRLYIPSRGKSAFACRLCHRLTYRSVQTHDSRVDALVKNGAALWQLTLAELSAPVPTVVGTSLIFKANRKLAQKNEKASQKVRTT